MPGVYKRKTTRASYGKKALQDTLHAIGNGESVKSASSNYGVPCKTMRCHRDGKVANLGKTRHGRFQSELNESYEDMLVLQIQAMENPFSA